MRIHLIAVGKKMPDWVERGYQEFAKRLSHECPLQLIELNPATRSKSTNVDVIKHKEAEQICTAIPKGARVIVLDEHGTQHSTMVLANKIRNWQAHGQDVCLIIGGADGLDQDLIRDADEVWSLSQLTLPHAMVRVLVAEQLYRAFSILNNHPYHRE